jgi:hypothetical protein
MKLNLEIKPKEWTHLALLILLVYLLSAGKVEEAVLIFSQWLNH